MSDLSEIDLIRQGYTLDIFTIFGDDPYTIPLVILTHSWMKTMPSEGRNKTHLWSYASKTYDDFNNGTTLNDHTYRKAMDRLEERGVVNSIKIRGGRRPQYDYVLTEYGEAVCKNLKSSLLEQMRLEKWRRRSQRNSGEDGQNHFNMPDR